MVRTQSVYVASVQLSGLALGCIMRRVFGTKRQLNLRMNVDVSVNATVKVMRSPNVIVRVSESVRISVRVRTHSRLHLTQVLRYSAGQHYHAHHDYFDPKL